MCTPATSESEYLEEMQPFTEEDLSILYPNPQLDTQTVLEDTFIRVRKVAVVPSLVYPDKLQDPSWCL